MKKLLSCLLCILLIGCSSFKTNIKNIENEKSETSTKLLNNFNAELIMGYIVLQQIKHKHSSNHESIIICTNTFKKGIKLFCDLFGEELYYIACQQYIKTVEEILSIIMFGILNNDNALITIGSTYYVEIVVNINYFDYIFERKNFSYKTLDENMIIIGKLIENDWKSYLE